MEQLIRTKIDRGKSEGLLSFVHSLGTFTSMLTYYSYWRNWTNLLVYYGLSWSWRRSRSTPKFNIKMVNDRNIETLLSTKVSGVMELVFYHEICHRWWILTTSVVYSSILRVVFFPWVFIITIITTTTVPNVTTSMIVDISFYVWTRVGRDLKLVSGLYPW